jgi:hypothetical protein
MHPLLDLAVDVAIVSCNVSEFVVCNDILWHVCDPQSHVFIPCHWGVEVEILNVHSHKFCVGGADDAVEEELDGEEIGSRGACVSWVVHSVASRH